LTLALLHMAVGRAGGLDVQLVGLPGHIVTRVAWGLGSEPPAGDGSSSSSGGGGGSEQQQQQQQQQEEGGRGGAGLQERWVDVFDGGTVMYLEGLR
jgi:hypothetical protein